MSKREVNVYPVEFKKSSAELAANSPQSISQTAIDLGININTLHTWVKKYHPKAAPPQPGNNDLIAQINQLKKENIRLKQERDILKKATAYFASETL